MRQEVTGARKDEFDLEAGLWEIRAERTKNGLKHCVPLSSISSDIIRRALAVQENKRHERENEAEENQFESKFLFASPRATEVDDRPVTPLSVTRAMRNNLTHFGFEADKDGNPIGATPHDLRRTGATMMTQNGVTRFVVSKLLNHTDRSDRVTQIYDRNEYLVEKAAAMQVWNDKLLDIFSGETPVNVVKLKRKA